MADHPKDVDDSEVDAEPSASKVDDPASDDAGGPSVDDAIDPELVKLPRKRARLSPYLAFAVIALCALLVMRLWSDLRYSQAGEAATVLRSSEEVFAADLNRYVELEALPDRAQLLRVTSSSSDQGVVLAPVLGSKGRLWLALPGTPWIQKPRYDERYSGRLMRFAEMPFADDLQGFLHTAEPLPRPVLLDEVRRAVREKATSLHDPAGDVLSVTADTPVRIVERSVAAVKITAYATDSYPDEASWRLALQNAAVLQSTDVAVAGTEVSWTYHATTREGAKAIEARLLEARLLGARVEPLTATRKARWGEVMLEGEDIVVGQPPAGFVPQSIAIAAPPPVADDARILVTTEVPSDFWYVMPIAVVLALFALLFAYGAWRSLRG